jgi:hypothetical protein
MTPTGQVMARLVFGTGVQGITVDGTTGNCFGVGSDAVWEIPAAYF